MVDEDLEVRNKKSMDVLCTIQVSNGGLFLPYLSIVNCSGIYYYVQHKLNHLPLPCVLDGRDYVASYNYTCTRSSSNHMLMSMYRAITLWGTDTPHKEHLNPFTYLYTYVKCETGYDLFKEGLFQL